MMRIIKINEQQYRRLMLDEEMHYPKFLDILKNEISTKVHIEIEKQLSNNKTDFEFSLPLKCEYTDNIIFKINIDKTGDITNDKEYKCFYYNEYNSLIDNKLINPQIMIQCPSKNKKVMFPLLKAVLSHEITHLYDDWSELMRNGSGINYFNKNIDTTNFINSSFQMNDELYKSLSIMAYMSLKVERQAFVSQTVQELESLGCTLTNYKQKIKETALYNNISNGYNNLLKEINNSSDYILYNCNLYILNTYPKANLPKMNIGDFDTKKYREKLLKWSDFVYHNTMKMYGSIVQYYLNQLKERKEKLNDIFIY